MKQVGHLAAVVACAAVSASARAAETVSGPPPITTPDKIDHQSVRLSSRTAPQQETVAKAYDYLDQMHGVEAFRMLTRALRSRPSSRA
jgi:hypothetical protein